MHNDAPKQPGPSDLKTSAQSERADIEKLLRTLGQALNNLSIFGEHHKATRQSLDEGYAAFKVVVANHPFVTLGADKEHLVCNAHTIETNTALLRTLLRRWTALSLGSLELGQGMTHDEFIRLIMVLGTASDEAASRTALVQSRDGSGFAHLHLKRMSYQAISEDDVVVKKPDNQSPPAPATKKKTDPVPALNSEIIAFLQSPTALPLTPSADAAELAAQPAKLAELLLQAADIRPETAQLTGGEQLGNLVVGCLRRLHDHLATTPTAKTKQGKKAIQQTLIMLEKEVIEKLRAMSDTEAVAEAIPDIEAAIGEMVGEVRVDDIIEDYARKRRQIENSEKRLISLLKSKHNDLEHDGELEKLQQKLSDSGMTANDWNALLQKSTAPVVSTPGGSGAEAPPLTLLLLRLTEILTPAQEPQSPAPLQAQLEPIVSQLNTGMNTAMAGVEQKMGTLRENIKSMAPLPETSDPQVVQDQALSRRKIIAILAEIVQELRQPLAVISGAVETLSGGHLGKLPDMQREMLQLALQSSRRVAVIVDALADISGSPATLQPDAQILKRIYQP